MDCQDYITESVERKKGQHLQREERGAIQHLKNAGYTNRAIARAIGCSPTTVGNELKRGTPPRRSSKGRKPGYSARRGEAVYKANRKRSRRPHRICHCTRFIYRAIQEDQVAYGEPIDEACRLLRISRSAYYKWASGKLSSRAVENAVLAEKIEQIHTESPDKGYRRINDELRHDHDIYVNDKRILRICRAKGIKSTIKYSSHSCTRQAKSPQYIAENLLNRQFYADKPNEKWLTDVTEFKWYEGIEVHKVYLSAILDLYDRRIVSYVIRDRNDNPLVFQTFDNAMKDNPDAHPLFHSDRGLQYTNRTFHHKIEKAGMTQSMSHVAHCIDNGPMEGFWGILKRERYYGKRFYSKKALVDMIENFIRYYNTRRVQRKLGVLTPMEKHLLYLAA